MTLWLNNSNGLRVKKLRDETGCEVENEMTGGRTSLIVWDFHTDF